MSTPKLPVVNLPSDSFETATSYIIGIELAGVAKKDVGIEIKDSNIVVTAEKKNPFSKERRIDAGRLYGNYESKWVIPKDGDAEKINAALNEGLLTITIPKTKKREVKINLE